jgi:8-oxo-dGTP pyrophosphatase MutT (NUDIX family)
MTSPRRLATRGIIFKDGKLLCQQLKPDGTGKVRDYWCTPGGGLDPDEALIDGLYRELIEETGIAPKIGRLLFVQQFKDTNRGVLIEQLEFFFLIENPEDYETIDLSATTHGELEIEHMKFIDVHEHTVLPKFLQTINLEQYSNTVQPVCIYTELPANNEQAT